MSPDLHHLSGAYAVDALDDAERTSFEQHLAVCADCRAEVAELSATAQLPRLARPRPPRPRRCAPRCSAASPRCARSRRSPRMPVRRIAPGSDRPPIRRWRARSTTPSRMPGFGRADPSPSAHRLVRRGRGRRGHRHRRAGVEPVVGRPGSQSPMAQVAAAADAMRVSSTKGALTARGRLQQAARQGRDHVTGLPPAPDGKTYQLWYVGPDGAASSAGLLEADAEGSGSGAPPGRRERRGRGGDDGGARGRVDPADDRPRGGPRPRLTDRRSWGRGVGVRRRSDRGGDGLEHGLVTGVRAVRSGPVGDDVGEAELGRAPGHLGVQVDRLQGVARRGVEQEVAVERAAARCAHSSSNRATRPATWSNHSSTVSPLPPYVAHASPSRAASATDRGPLPATTSGTRSRTGSGRVRASRVA